MKQAEWAQKMIKDRAAQAKQQMTILSRAGGQTGTIMSGILPKLGTIKSAQYTGDGPKDQPAGVVQTNQGDRMVHKGELKVVGQDNSMTVLPQTITSQMQMKGMPGYADGTPDVNPNSTTPPPDVPKPTTTTVGNVGTIASAGAADAAYRTQSMKALSDTAAGNSALDRNTANRTLQQNDAAAAAKTTANLQTAASNPNMTDAAKAGLAATMSRDQSATRANLSGQLAQTAETNQQNAIGTLASQSLTGEQYDKSSAYNDYINKYNDYINKYNAALAAKDPKAAADAYQAYYGSAIDMSQVQQDIANQATIGANQAAQSTTATQTANEAAITQKINDKATLEEVNSTFGLHMTPEEYNARRANTQNGQYLNNTQYQIALASGDVKQIQAAYKAITGQDLDPTQLATDQKAHNDLVETQVKSAKDALGATEFSNMMAKINSGATKDQIKAEFPDLTDDMYKGLSEQYAQKITATNTAINSAKLQLEGDKLGLALKAISESGGNITSAQLKTQYGLDLDQPTIDALATKTKQNFTLTDLQVQQNQETVKQLRTTTLQGNMNAVSEEINKGYDLASVNAKFGTNLTQDQFNNMLGATPLGDKDWTRKESMATNFLNSSDPAVKMQGINLLKQTYPTSGIDFDTLATGENAANFTQGLSQLQDYSASGQNWETVLSEITNDGTLAKLKGQGMTDEQAKDEAYKLFNGMKVNSVDMAIDQINNIKGLNAGQRQTMIDTYKTTLTGEADFTLQPTYPVINQLGQKIGTVAANSPEAAKTAMAEQYPGTGNTIGAEFMGIVPNTDLKQAGTGATTKGSYSVPTYNYSADTGTGNIWVASAGQSAPIYEVAGGAAKHALSEGDTVSFGANQYIVIEDTHRGLLPKGTYKIVKGSDLPNKNPTGQGTNLDGPVYPTGMYFVSEDGNTVVIAQGPKPDTSKNLSTIAAKAQG